MRLIATLQDQEKAVQLSNYLKSQNIDNECEVTVSSDWGDPQYGVPICRIWIRDEDHLKTALEIANEFSVDSTAPRFQAQDSKNLRNELSLPASLINGDLETSKEGLSKNTEVDSRSEWRNEPMGFMTIFLLVACCLLFFLTNTTTPTSESEEQNKTELLPQIPFRYSSLEKNLLFDYPQTFEIVDSIIEKITTEHITKFDPMPASLEPLYQKFQITPYWKGYYERIASYFEKMAGFESSLADKSSANVPWFEKIQQGEWWRLITPAFLHGGYLHLLFNMLWLIILGKQLEQRLGWQRYLFFVIITAIFSNTSQYLMGGFNFVGFSGVICAMIAFVWVRQKSAPWEGYLLQTSTLNFVMLFLVSILFLQMVSFFMEVTNKQSITPGIANSAHFSGLLIGGILGKLDFFSWKHWLKS